MADSPGVIYSTLVSVGFSRLAAITGTAIVLAESGGNRTAAGDSGVSLGWWQINTRAHPEVTRECAFDPVCSSRFAYRLSNGGRRWTPWSVFNTGAYRSRIPTARLGARNAPPAGVTPGGTGPGGTVVELVGCVKNGKPGVRPKYTDGSLGPCSTVDPTGAVNTVGDAVGGIAEWVTKLVTRVGVGAIGVALLLLGAVMIGKDASISSAANQLGKAIGKGVRGT